MRWLYKLDYKYGRYYIRNLMTIIVAGMIGVFVADLLFLNVNISSWLTLDRDAILSGQIWRLVTFLFVPPSYGAFSMAISCYLYYILGGALQSVWGGFRFNFYYLLGTLGAIIVTFIIGYGSNYYLNSTLFLAYATLSPDTTFYLFWLIPIKAKWLALFYAFATAVNLIQTFQYSTSAGLTMLLLLAFSLVNYLIFFGPRLLEIVRDKIRMAQNRRNWRNNNR